VKERRTSAAAEPCTYCCRSSCLLDALTDAQRRQAILNYQVNDLILGPGQAWKQIAPEGLKGLKDVAFLASARGAFISGADYIIDGGTMPTT
jgi:hypothetical protein